MQQIKPVHCPRRHGVECETPNSCAGGISCRFGPDLTPGLIEDAALKQQVYAEIRQAYTRACLKAFEEWQDEVKGNQYEQEEPATRSLRTSPYSSTYPEIGIQTVPPTKGDG